MDIKLKIRHKKLLGAVMVCLTVIFICSALYSFVDNSLNGVFLDWFTKNYMTEQYDTTAGGELLLVWEPYWPAVKVLIFQTFIFFAALASVIAYFVSAFKARERERQVITATSRMLHDYMSSDREASEIFPKEYAEISAQAAEIKNTIDHHEQVMKEENARKNDLITYLAHDLKTPLTSVIGYMSLLDEIPEMPEEQRKKYVRITLDKAKRLEVLINEFFDITRYNLQHIELEKEPIDLCYMLVQMTDEFYPILQAHGNSVELCVDEDMTIYGDAEKLARVFNNILKNAVAYSYPDTSIKVWAVNSDEATDVFIQNRGKTIPQHKLESIFEKFFRLDDARRTNTGGAGLGLAIAREIVNLHGGYITAKSENELTTFRVSLPKEDEK